MKRNFYVILLFCLLAPIKSMAWQTYEVPVSMHETDQVVQGPCYIFATLAALESKAIQHAPNAVGGGQINFYEWLFYSDGVVGKNNWAGGVMITKTLEHMINRGAKNRVGHTNPVRPQLPNLHWSEHVREELTGIAYFQQNPNSQFESCNTSWWDNFGQYNQQSGSACTDYSGTPGESSSDFFITPGGTPAAKDHYDLELPLNWSSAKPYHREGAATLTSPFNMNPRHDQIERVLRDENVGVIAIFEDYNGVQGIEHAIFIYKKQGSLYWFKDSWPSPYDSHDPIFVKPDDPGQALPLGELKEIFYIPGTVKNHAPVVNPTTNACDYDIAGPSQVRGLTLFELDNGTEAATNIQWTVTGNLEIVSGQGTAGIQVQSTNCGFLGTTATISVTYDNEGTTACPESKTVTALDRLLSTPTSIQINGPISGLSQVCPGSVIQLEAPESGNLPYPETDYEWQITGAMILNGQGTPVINIQVSGVPSAYQYYKVRVKDDVCNNTSSWRTISGYIASSCGGGGGVGIFPSVVATGDQVDFTGYFEEVSDAKSVQMDIYSVDGRRLLSTKARSSDSVVRLSSLPKGVAIIRMYNPDTGEFKSFRHLINY